MIIYLLLLVLLAGVHHLYLGHPLSQLYYIERPDVWELGVEVEMVLGASLGLCVVGLSRLISARFQWARKIDEDFAALFAHHSSLQLTGLALMSSLAEEVLFRGVLLDAIGLLWSASLFGALHVPLERHHWPWSVAALLMGFAVGGVTLFTGSITVAFVAHFTVNHFNLHALRSLTASRREV